MLRRLGQGAARGDFNSIVDLKDSKQFPQNKISPSCTNLIRAFSWMDSFRALKHRAEQFSRYQTQDGDRATRIDRSYHWGDLQVSEAACNSISFSDHLSLKVSYFLPHTLDRHLTPHSTPSYKIPPSVVKDDLFQTRLRTSMAEWLRVKSLGANIITWWQHMVKGGSSI